MRRAKNCLLGKVFVIWKMDDEDVPPLEDLTEAVQKARALRTEPQLRDETRAGDDRAAKDGVKKRTQPKETPAKATELFGGFSKGFLLSNPAASSDSTKASTSTSHTKSEAVTHPSESNLSDDGDIPFLKAKRTAQGPVLPEVQEAMNEAYPLLNTGEWLTESLLEKIERHPILSKALQDPRLAQAMSQFQSNPTAVLQSAAGNPELQAFLREFCSLMGNHFSELANKDDGASNRVPMDKDVEKTLSQKGVKEALTDPHVQKLLNLLRSDPPKAQRMLSSANTDLRQKVQVLIDNGLLAIQ